MKKIVKCPICGEKLFKVNRFTPVVVPVKCKSCGWLIRYSKIDNKIKIRKVPSRTSSGAMRFY